MLVAIKRSNKLSLSLMPSSSKPIVSLPPADDEQLDALTQRLITSGALRPGEGSDGTLDSVSGQVQKRRGHARTIFVDVLAGTERLQAIKTAAGSYSKCG